MKLTDSIISAILKKGVIFESRNVDVEFELPKMMTQSEEIQSEKTKIFVKAEHVTVKLENE